MAEGPAASLPINLHGRFVFVGFAEFPFVLCGMRDRVNQAVVRAKAWRCRCIARDPSKQAHIALLSLASAPLDALLLSLEALDEAAESLGEPFRWKVSRHDRFVEHVLGLCCEVSPRFPRQAPPFWIACGSGPARFSDACERRRRFWQTLWGRIARSVWALSTSRQKFRTSICKPVGSWPV